MKYLWKKQIDPKRFGGSIGSKEAELSDATVKELGMQSALLRFAKALAGQYKGYGRKATQYSEGAEVIGIEIHSVNFTLITQPIPKTK